MPCHGQRTALAARARSQRLNGRGDGGARAGYSATNRFAKAAFLVDREQSHARAMPYEQLGVISTATTPTFDDFSRTLSVPCVQYPGAYANMHMYMGDNKRTFTKSASFLPFIRVAFNTRGTRRAPAKAKHFVQGHSGATHKLGKCCGPSCAATPTAPI